MLVTFISFKDLNKIFLLFSFFLVISLHTLSTLESSHGKYKKNKYTRTKVFEDVVVRMTMVMMIFQKYTTNRPNSL